MLDICAAWFQGELASFEATRDLRFLPGTLFDKIFFPVIFTLDPQRAAELRYQQYSWLIAYAAIIGLLAERLFRLFRKPAGQRRWNPEARFLLAFFCTSYLLWLNIFGIYRYLIVIELLLPLLLFVIITNFFNWRRAPGAALVFLAVLTIVNLRGVPDWGHAGWAQTVYHIAADALQSEPEPAAIGSYYYAGREPFPRVWIAQNVIVEANDAVVRERLLSLETNPLQTVYLERALDCAGGGGTAAISAYGPNEVTITADGGGGGLVLSDQYYPGWRATVDGEQVEIVRADTLFRAVCLPPGSHTVQFDYRPQSLLVGVIVSAVGWIVWLALLGFAWRRRVNYHRQRRWL